MTVMRAYFAQSRKEVIALDADDHLLRPIFMNSRYSDLRLLRIEPAQQMQVDRIQARDDIPAMCAV